MKFIWRNSNPECRTACTSLTQAPEESNLKKAGASSTTQTSKNIPTRNNMPPQFFFKQNHCPSFEKKYQISSWINWECLIIFSVPSQPVSLLTETQSAQSSKMLNTCNSQTWETWVIPRAECLARMETLCSFKLRSDRNTALNQDVQELPFIQALRHSSQSGSTIAVSSHMKTHMLMCKTRPLSKSRAQGHAFDQTNSMFSWRACGVWWSSGNILHLSTVATKCNSHVKLTQQ